jgi:type II secretory ATPase GspE/PulE/Tfp pilus assembly ATPase PilB-like protein
MATIMIVEDNIIYRELLCELCEMSGHDVIDTAQAEEALALLSNYDRLDVSNQRRSIDLFITDFNMDGMNGFEFLREVRRHDALRHVPVLMISSTNKDMREMLSLEGVAFLPKPSANALVIERIQFLIENSAARRKEALSPEARSPAEQPVAPDAKATPPKPAAAPAPPAPPATSTAPKAAAESEETLPPFLSGYSVPSLPVEPPIEPRSVSPGHRRRLHLRPARAIAAPPPAVQAKAPPPPPPAPTAPPPEPASAEARPDSPDTGETLGRLPVFGSLDDGIRNHIAGSAKLSDFLNSRQRSADTDAAEASALGEMKSPVADLLEKILDGALHKQASDIHFEPSEDIMEVRVRVDGALQSLVRLPATILENMTARIKILSNLNITEKRLPQDGQFSWTSPSGKAAKFRVSTLPSVHGEKVVIRVLPTESLKAKLDSIGLSAEEFALVKRVLSSPNGLILATGPTGSGKTTTLYTMLESLNTPQRNIITVEDPVEYQLPGITQVQINSTIGFTFEKVLRSILRQDPDVLLVGEIRDAETGEIALKAAVTGRIVLSTLHTNDAAAAVHRMISMGLSAHLVAAATRLVIAQRLVRRLCRNCRVEDDPTDAETMAFEADGAGTPTKVWRPKGCQACHGVGYLGRKPVFEILPILTHETRLAVSRGASPHEIRASAPGMATLRGKALKLVTEGATSAEEALSVLYCL